VLGVISLLLSVTAPTHGREGQAARRYRSPRGTQGRPVAMKPIAAVRVITAEELRVLLKHDGNRPLLVNYWATWCDPCREEFPDLVRVDHDYRARGLDTIAISLDDLAELKTEVPRFLRLMKARMPVYLLNVADPEPSIKMVDSTWAGALPATFLYNPAGEIVFKKFGRFDTVELRAAVERVMSGK
jgi:thiol-disulfide isomerase/thioredoxin